MSGDPLFLGLYFHRQLTPGDLGDAIQYRVLKREELTAEINILKGLLDLYNEALAVRDERDRPLTPAERGCA